MTNTPIARIPLDPEYSLEEIFLRTHEDFAIPMTLAEVMMELIDPEDNAAHYETVMDWASQLRRRFECDWSTAIRVASVMYFG